MLGWPGLLKVAFPKLNQEHISNVNSEKVPGTQFRPNLGSGDFWRLVVKAIEIILPGPCVQTETFQLLLLPHGKYVPSFSPGCSAHPEQSYRQTNHPFHSQADSQCPRLSVSLFIFSNTQLVFFSSKTPHHCLNARSLLKDHVWLLFENCT